MKKLEKRTIELLPIEENEPKRGGFLSTIGNSFSSAISVFTKDEKEMTLEEQVEKQNLLTFIYGMGAGIVVYHFMIGAVLILGIVGFYSFSLKKTKRLVQEQQKPVKRTYKKKKKVEEIVE